VNFTGVDLARINRTSDVIFSRTFACLHCQKLRLATFSLNEYMMMINDDDDLYTVSQFRC